MNNQFNPYGQAPFYSPTPQDNINRLTNQLNQYNQMMQQYGQQAPVNNVAMSNRGVYVYVNDYQEVVNYPTPVDGNAVLFFNLDKGVMWSKKFVNGTNSIQAFTISPLNQVGNAQEAPVVQQEAPTIDKRVSDLEIKLNKLIDMLTTPAKKEESNESTRSFKDGKQSKSNDRNVAQTTSTNSTTSV